MRPVPPIALLATTVAAAILAVGCGGGGATRPAAIVDGFEISQQDVVDELEAIGANDLFVEGSTAAGQAVLGETDGSYDSAFVSSVLNTEVAYQLVLNEVVRRSLAIDEPCRQAARQAAADRLTSRSPTGDGQSVFDAFGEDYQRTLVDREAGLLALQGDLVGQACVEEDATRNYYDEHRDLFDVETACVSHILFNTAEEATSAAALLAGGADFNDLAVQLSIDPSAASNGGELGCVTQSDGIVPEFLEATFSQPVGEVGPPVQTEFGFHLILVSSRGVPEFDEIEADVAQALADEVQGAFSAFFGTALDTAVVDVDPRYGVWNAATGQIERPPAGATGEPTTTLPSG